MPQVKRHGHKCLWSLEYSNDYDDKVILFLLIVDRGTILEYSFQKIILLCRSSCPSGS